MPSTIEVKLGKAIPVGSTFVVVVPGRLPDTVRLILPASGAREENGEWGEWEDSSSDIEAAAAEIMAAIKSTRGRHKRRRIDKAGDTGS